MELLLQSFTSLEQKRTVDLTGERLASNPLGLTIWSEVAVIGNIGSHVDLTSVRQGYQAKPAMTAE